MPSGDNYMDFHLDYPQSQGAMIMTPKTRLVAVCLNDGLLTEGQVSKIIEADRLRVREVRDEGMMCLSYRPLLGEWGAATMNRMFG